jgi:hypothetical protein
VFDFLLERDVSTRRRIYLSLPGTLEPSNYDHFLIDYTEQLLDLHTTYEQEQDCICSEACEVLKRQSHQQLLSACKTERRRELRE